MNNVQTDIPMCNNGKSLPELFDIAKQITRGISGIKDITMEDVFVNTSVSDDGSVCLSLHIETKPATKG